MDSRRSRKPIAPDYDRDPERFRLARSVVRRHGLADDIHERVARRLLRERLTPVLDVGCGEGELARHLPRGHWVGLDASAEMLARAPQPAVRGDARALPFPDAAYGSVALLYVLYHVAEPVRPLPDARRVLRAGGLVAVAAATSTLGRSRFSCTPTSWPAAGQSSCSPTPTRWQPAALRSIAS